MRADVRLHRPERDRLVLRVADLFDADPADVTAAAARLDPAPDAVHLVPTAAGCLVTLEATVAGPFRRAATIRNLQASLSVLRRGLECPPMSDGRRLERQC